MTDVATNSLLYDQLESTFPAICPSARLEAASTRLRNDYENAKPYPHIVIDGLYDTAVLEHICSAFPKPEDRDWLIWNSSNEHKSFSRGARTLRPRRCTAIRPHSRARRTAAGS